MFNLTNVVDVINFTAVPAYEQVGPYMYRRYRKVCRNDVQCDVASHSAL
jgi:hypothetical protein